MVQDLPTLGLLKHLLAPVFEGGSAQKVLLFGSYARGEADRFSDLDLLIIADSQRPFVERFKDFRDLWRLSPVKSLNVFVYTPEEFHWMREQESPFILKAVEEGQVIYEAGPVGRSRPVAPAGGE